MAEDKKVINSQVTGNYIKRFEVLKASLELSELKKTEANGEFLEVAIDSVAYVIADYKRETGKELPSKKELAEFLARKGDNFTLLSS
ncbi:MAG: hypothetical protein U9N57_01385 [Pseudomonadota bacterium]|nr:hypothetical protein [Pseudomonadota bacterium]